jgi:hypothetical protein
MGYRAIDNNNNKKKKKSLITARTKQVADITDG